LEDLAADPFFVLLYIFPVIFDPHLLSFFDLLSFRSGPLSAAKTQWKMSVSGLFAAADAAAAAAAGLLLLAWYVRRSGG